MGPLPLVAHFVKEGTSLDFVVQKRLNQGTAAETGFELQRLDSLDTALSTTPPNNQTRVFSQTCQPVAGESPDATGFRNHAALPKWLAYKNSVLASKHQRTVAYTEAPEFSRRARRSF